MNLINLSVLSIRDWSSRMAFSIEKQPINNVTIIVESKNRVIQKLSGAAD
jgi:hypothetical protein